MTLHGTPSELPLLIGQPFIEAPTMGKERVTRGEVAEFLTGFLRFRKDPRAVVASDDLDQVAGHPGAGETTVITRG